MTVIAERMPTERTLLTVVDEEARSTVKKAQSAMAPVVTAETPRASGATAGALAPRVGRSGTGHSLTIAAPRGRVHPRSSTGATIAQVIRWVTRGTGLERVGPGAKSRIRGQRVGFRREPLSVYGRAYSSVRGQKANPFMSRISAAGSLRVEPLLIAGAQEAARALERVID